VHRAISTVHCSRGTCICSDHNAYFVVPCSKRIVIVPCSTSDGCLRLEATNASRLMIGILERSIKTPAIRPHIAKWSVAKSIAYYLLDCRCSTNVGNLTSAGATVVTLAFVSPPFDVSSNEHTVGGVVHGDFVD
jgi:hypothetical protein